jgi:periplasmic protein CpxP/Spy
MRKNILMALGFAASLAGVAAAQQQPGAEPPRREDHRGGRFEGRGGPGGMLFQNITLTQAQKTQLQTLRKAQRDKMEANKDQWQKQREELQAARQRGDTAAVKAIRDRQRAAMEQARTQEFAAIRNVLTPEQRVQFDKNVAELKQREQERAKQFGERGGRKSQRRPGA